MLQNVHDNAIMDANLLMNRMGLPQFEEAMLEQVKGIV
jgi:hypothetical protein